MILQIIYDFTSSALAYSYSLRFRKILLTFIFLNFMYPSIYGEEKYNVDKPIQREISVTGTITDKRGVPLPGVNVLVKGTSKGVSTDFDGNYLIKTEGNSVLIFSYLGFQPKEIAINNQTRIDVQLVEDASELEEILVVGYGTQSKAKVTGAVSTVASEEITALPVASFTDAIQGRVPGVQVTNFGAPGTSPIVRIRGIGSISFASNPLYVVDGYPVGGLLDFDNNDIESISILKDASATAIYGSRASNGVVIVTTKRGRINEGLKLNYNSFVGYAKEWRRLDLLNRDQYLEYGRELLSNNGDAFPSRWSNLNEPIYAGASQTYAETDTDYQDAIFRNALTQSHHIGLRGGGEYSSFYGSFGYFEQEGIMVGTSYDRFNFRINSDHQLKDWIKIGETLTLSSGFRDNELELGSRTQIQNVIRGIPYIPLFDPTLPGGLRAPDGSDGSDPENPLRAALLDQDDVRNVRIFGTAFTEIDLLSNLKYRFTIGLDWNNSRREIVLPIYFDGFGGREDLILQENRSTFVGHYYSNQLDYNQSFGKHTVDFVAVAERQDSDFGSLFALGTRDNNNILVLDGTENQVVGGSEGKNILYSFVGRLNYDFDDKYLFSASLRRDGSSKFAEGFKWRTFPAVSAGWNIAKEAFMEDVSAITDLKIRASWGEVGFEGIGNFESQAGISSNTAAVFGNETQQGAFFDRLANPELEWEVTEMINVGIDIGLFNNRVQFSGEWYERKTDNLILGVPLPPSQGFSRSPIANVGSMENWGLEFQTTYYSKAGRDFQWNIAANLGLFRNEVVSLATPTSTIFAGSNPDFGGFDITRTAPGDPIQSFYGWRVEGIFQSQSQIDEFNALNPDQPYQANAQPGDIIFRDLNGDGTITADDREVLGSFIPDFNYGINFEASYKNFNLTMFWNGVQGNEIYNGTKVLTQGGLRLFNAGTAVLDAWTPTNTDTNVPRMVNGDPNQNTRTSDRFIEDGSFLRLQTLRIGYNFTEKWLQQHTSNTIRNFGIYISGNNLVTFTDYSGYDPEIGSRLNALNTVGVDYGQFPRPRTILLGVQLGF